MLCKPDALQRILPCGKAAMPFMRAGVPSMGRAGGGQYAYPVLKRPNRVFRYGVCVSSSGGVRIPRIKTAKSGFLIRGVCITSSSLGVPGGVCGPFNHPATPRGIEMR